MSVLEINSIDDIRDLFKHEWLAYSEIVQLKVLDTSETAYAIEIPIENIEKNWKLVNKLLKSSNMTPVISSYWSDCKNFKKTVMEEDIFSRFYFDEAPKAGCVNPKEIIKRSESVDVDSFLKNLLNEENKYSALEDLFDDLLEYELDQSLYFTNNKVTKADIPKELTTRYDLDLWLMKKELLNGGLGIREHGRVSLYNPDNAYILILPIESTWEALAYINWFGTSDYGSEYYIALGKRWEKEYGAELYCHYGTMLQCVVERPPTDPLLAWELACCHDLIASCTFSHSVRYYANGLVDNGYWFLHERP